MSIKLEIEQWDGKSASDIGDVYDRHCHETSFVSDIVAFIENASLQKGATWLLKRYLENENKISENEVFDVYQKLGVIEKWESRLHILQSIPFMPIAKPDKKKVEAFLRGCLVDNNKFVRAWAYNGFYELTVQYTEYENVTKQFIERAMRDEAPSVKSRIRNIMKKGF